MSKSLSIILPVHNAQSRLASEVSDLLEVAGELSSQMEILVVDDGSTDDTRDVAESLSTRYPQVQTMGFPVRKGLGSVIEMGVAQTTGEIVLVHDGVGPIDPSDIQQLWDQSPWSHDTPGNSAAEATRASEERLSQYVASDSQQQPGRLRADSGMSRRRMENLSFHYVDRKSVPRKKRRNAPRREVTPYASLTNSQRSVGGASGINRPNFLERLTQFVLSQ